VRRDCWEAWCLDRVDFGYRCWELKTSNNHKEWIRAHESVAIAADELMQQTCINLCATLPCIAFDWIGRHDGIGGNWVKSFSMLARKMLKNAMRTLARFVLCGMTEKHWHGKCSNYFREIERKCKKAIDIATTSGSFISVTFADALRMRRCGWFHNRSLKKKNLSRWSNACGNT
jgi:hypothetical protein